MSSRFDIRSRSQSARSNMIVNHSRSKVRYFASFPEHNIIKLPNLSPTMETGTVISWAKNEGDQIAEGDLLAEIETDKATMSLDASEEGYIAKILAPAGTKDIPVGAPLCILVSEQSLVSQFSSFTSANVPMETAFKVPSSAHFKPRGSIIQISNVSKAVKPVVLNQQPIVSQSGARIFASPLAKQLAKYQGIDLANIGIGSGLLGMITSLDLFRGPELGSKTVLNPQSDLSTKVPLSNMRLVIAKRLLESKRTIPHYYLSVDIEVDSAMALRESINAKFSKQKEDLKISLNDLIIKAISSACLKVPECNSAWMGDFIRQYTGCDISVAIATPNGLITPIVKDAQNKSLTEISANVKDLASKARANNLQPHEYQGGTITLSNLGMFGISNFSAIINPPQACILAVGSSRKHVLPASNHRVRVSEVMTVTLCCDHRVVDGAVGAQWLGEFKQALENPAMMLM